MKKGSHHTEESKRKLSESKTGKKLPPRSPEYIEMLKARRKKQSPPTLGMKWSDETREKLRLSRLGRKIHTEEFKRRFSEERKGCGNPMWQGGASYGKYCEKFDEPFKRRVRAFFGNVCMECGCNKEYNNNKNMSVHHVNYDKLVCCNDKPRLFVTLCNSCHGKTSINKEYWMNKFTTLINTKYKGNCYLPKE
jgi:hypothetical protein